jgi:hypothetical protein
MDRSQGAFTINPALFAANDSNALGYDYSRDAFCGDGQGRPLYLEIPACIC